ncbi:hypothetical protein [Streptomyces sp. NPDC013455]|uniref:hypothetical protein n=1 Tax=Streptomyces sp. NPDC013455 TaxID=3155605 RepID=UPI003401E4C5
MSDDWKQKAPYKADVEQANAQVGVVNAVSALQRMFRGTPMGSAMSLGRTDFENHDLNDMIDLVRDANPEHLEAASKALWDARTAIHDAAKDLETHLADVDWEGEGATAFQSWTKGLIGWSQGLATFADVAATEISAAATGLASVRSAMPPRDTRPADEQKRPEKLPKAKQVDGDPDYAAALAVEKNRQEAINQMNRLASFYSVSASTLGTQLEAEPKPFEPIPDVGVPRPSGREKNWVQGGSGAAAAAALRDGVAVDHSGVTEGHHGTASVPGSGNGGAVPPLREVHEPSAPPGGGSVGTEINTTTTLPPQAPTTPPSSPAPTLPTTGGSGQVPPFVPGPVTPPVTPATGRTPGYGPAGRSPYSPQGRTGPSGTGGGRVPQGPVGQPGRAVAGGRVPQGPVGQPGRAIAGGRVPQGPLGQGPMGQAARATGRSAPAGQPGVRGTGQPGPAPIGRSVTGGTPRPTNAPGGQRGTTGPTGPVGAARNGVVGGKPITGRPSPEAAGPRVPRGMVVGADEPVSSTPSKGAVGQRGVVGAPTAKVEPGAGQGMLRSAGNPEGVIGAPRNTAGSSLKGSDGTGLGRGAVGGRQGPAGTGGPAGNEQHRSPQQRRDVPQKSD